MRRRKSCSFCLPLCVVGVLLVLPAVARADDDTAPAVAPPAAQVSEKSWYQRFELMAFVDAYYQVNTNFPKPDVNDAGVRGFEAENGFNLQWAGFDLSYPAEPVGGTIAFRFGPTATRFSYGDEGLGFGLEFLKEAFVTLAPLSWLTIDFGKFGTIYGAEVPESWQNYNYTRGVVNWATQPFYHTGLRVGVDLTHGFTLTALAVNGWDSTIDNNTMKTFGAQLGWSNDLFGISLGYLGGPEQDETVEMPDLTDPSNTVRVRVDGANSRWRHFGNLIATFTPRPHIGIILDADIGAEKLNIAPGVDETVLWYGVALAGQVRLNPMWALALRGEFMGDPDGYRIGEIHGLNDLKVVTGTVTVDFTPWKHLVLRLDNRVDWADSAIFRKSLDQAKQTQFTTTLGVVFYVDA